MSNGPPSVLERERFAKTVDAYTRRLQAKKRQQDLRSKREAEGLVQLVVFVPRKIREMVATAAKMEGMDRGEIVARAIFKSELGEFARDPDPPKKKKPAAKKLTAKKKKPAAKKKPAPKVKKAAPKVKRRRILKKYGNAATGRRFAAVEIDGERIDVITRYDRDGSEETRAKEIYRMAETALSNQRILRETANKKGHLIPRLKSGEVFYKTELQAVETAIDAADAEIRRKSRGLAGAGPWIKAFDKMLGLAALKTGHDKQKLKRIAGERYSDVIEAKSLLNP